MCTQARLFPPSIMIVLVVAAFWSWSETVKNHATESTSDPRAAFGTLTTDIRDGFGEGVEPYCAADDAPSRQATLTLKKLATAIGDLHSVCRRRFGDMDAVAFDPPLPEPTRHAWWDSSMPGRAVLHGAGEDGVPMIEVDGVWEFDISASVRCGRFTPPMQRYLAAMADHIETIATAISNGELTPRTAVRALADEQETLDRTFNLRRVSL